MQNLPKGKQPASRVEDTHAEIFDHLALWCRVLRKLNAEIDRAEAKLNRSRRQNSNI